MRRKLVLVVAATTIAITARAQTKIDLRTQGKSVDFSSATSTKPSKTGTAFPATCATGETFFKIDAPAGANLYGCTATNIWTVQSSMNALQLQGRSVAGAAPADTQVICWNAGVNTWMPCNSSSASSLTQLTDLRTTRANASSLVISSGNVEVNGVSYTMTAGTVTINAGSGTVRLGIDTSVTPPVGKVYYTAGLAVTCSGLGGCTTPVQGAAFGVDDIQLATWASTNGTFDINGATELRGVVSRSRTLAGTGMVSTFSGHTQTISVNTAVLPIFTLTPGTGAPIASGATITPTNRVHHITGAGSISTISAAGMMDGEVLTLIPDAPFTTVTGGNIAVSSTAAVSRAMRFIFDASTAKWFPSY